MAESWEDKQKRTGSGQAFPRAAGPEGGGFCNGAEGMTLRQFYAAKALPAIVGNCSAADNADVDGACERIASLAFKIADAMIREGNKPLPAAP